MACKRNFLKLEDKLKVIELSASCSHRKLAEDFSVGRTQISRIIKDKHKILNKLEQNCPLDRKRMAYNSKNDEINALTWNFFQEMSCRGIIMTGPMIQERARQYALQLNIDRFKASNGWLSSFTKRHGINPGKTTIIETRCDVKDLLNSLPRNDDIADENECKDEQDESLELMKMMQSMLPTFDLANRKGEHGRVGIFGGSVESAGSSYFAAISSLKVGADVSHVFCSSAAASIIRSYSPELIVHPILDDKDFELKIDDLLSQLDTLVVGPGLGTNQQLLNAIKHLISKAISHKLPIVIDGDGLHFVPFIIDIMNNFPAAFVLTANQSEFARLYRHAFNKETTEGMVESELKNLSIAMGQVTILLKGPVDIITNGQHVLTGHPAGGSRRCAGQGSLLSGALGTFVHWANESLKNGIDIKMFSKFGPCLCATYAASFVTRQCDILAFQERKRSALTSDMIDFIPQIVENIENCESV